MTHRGDSDWHGWPLQAIVDQVAQKEYERMRRDVWPYHIVKHTPDLLTDADPDVRRQVMEAVLPSVTTVLDVVNGMDHPVVTEVRDALTRLDAAYVARQHGGVAEHNAIEEIEQIIHRYTHTEEA